MRKGTEGRCPATSGRKRIDRSDQKRIAAIVLACSKRPAEKRCDCRSADAED